MATDLAPGDRAPAFKLKTDSGEEISKASLKGKPFVLYFYPKDDTSGCTKEAIEFSEASANSMRPISLLSAFPRTVSRLTKNSGQNTN